MNPADRKLTLFSASRSWNDHRRPCEWLPVKACREFAGLPHIVNGAMKRGEGGNEHNGTLATVCLVSCAV